ncbi:hypothetical protein Y1Q_0009689 [Alligator mississippiensis]|uniref:Uncharacterized protein n=1 Tax=Alligator mississippiensis TaxID=8496 RepID=A0A151MWE9_ALLMI|nr:hypothetical protein Y1Q_0009689 [Alligator mississippiensis]
MDGKKGAERGDAIHTKRSIRYKSTVPVKEAACKSLPETFLMEMVYKVKANRLLKWKMASMTRGRSIFFPSCKINSSYFGVSSCVRSNIEIA